MLCLSACSKSLVLDSRRNRLQKFSVMFVNSRNIFENLWQHSERNRSTFGNCRCLSEIVGKNFGNFRQCLKIIGNSGFYENLYEVHITYYVNHDIIMVHQRGVEPRSSAIKRRDYHYTIGETDGDGGRNT